MCDRTVCSCKNDDAVLPLRCDLNHSMSAWTRNTFQVINIDAAFLQGIIEHAAVFSDRTGKVHITPGSGKGNGLIESFAAGV